jgi:eukaryotic-like serine/threonine-protein kinase
VVASDPVANSKLPLGSVVNLVLSDGTVQIPDVRNLDVVEARNILTAPTIGYSVSIETLDGPTCAGQIGNIVLDQSVPAGQAPQMKSIILYVECIADPVVNPGTGN